MHRPLEREPSRLEDSNHAAGTVRYVSAIREDQAGRANVWPKYLLNNYLYHVEVHSRYQIP